MLNTKQYQKSNIQNSNKFYSLSLEERVRVRGVFGHSDL